MAGFRSAASAAMPPSALEKMAAGMPAGTARGLLSLPRRRPWSCREVVVSWGVHFDGGMPCCAAQCPGTPRFASHPISSATSIIHAPLLHQTCSHLFSHAPAATHPLLAPLPSVRHFLVAVPLPLPGLGAPPALAPAALACLPQPARLHLALRPHVVHVGDAHEEVGGGAAHLLRGLVPQVFHVGGVCGVQTWVCAEEAWDTKVPAAEPGATGGWSLTHAHPCTSRCSRASCDRA